MSPFEWTGNLFSVTQQLVTQKTETLLTHPLIKWCVLLLGCGLLTVIVIVPLDFYEQMGFCLFSIVAAMCIRKSSRARLAFIVLIVLSASASLRYMYWRLTSTVDFENLQDMVLGWGLVLAELYSLCVLLLGYVQTAWPLHRKPFPLPADSGEWPVVDILIPTYNEPLSVVRQTVFAALSQDWPPEKLRVHVLDDGNREEFRIFCQQAGAGYITRDEKNMPRLAT